MTKAHRRKASAAGLTCLTIAVLAGVLLKDRIPPLDAWLLDNWFAPGDSAAAQIARAGSGLGTLLGAFAVAAAMAGVARRRPAGRAGLLLKGGVLLVICAATVALQAVFRRPGPPVVSQDWTYPSGHVVMVSAAAFAAVVLSRHLSRPWQVTILASAASGPLVVAVSRMALGEHYLLDVAGASVAVIGIGLVAAALLGLLPNHQPAAVIPRG